MTGHKLAKATEPLIDWEPTPGYLLCKALKREELAALYSRSGGNNLSLPDRVGKVSDSVGAGIVIKVSKHLGMEWMQILKRIERLSGMATASPMAEPFTDIKPGDYVAWMPFTDLIIEIDGHKYSLIAYDKIRAIKKGKA